MTTTQQMRALSLSSTRHATLTETARPVPAVGEALVQVLVSALCGSELDADGDPNPGHEAAGLVEWAPSDSGLVPGELVGVSAVSGCGHCQRCRAGVALHCESGWRIQSGMHADYVAAPVSALRRVPPGTSPREAVLMSGDTLGVPVRALHRVPAGPRDRVLILGLGPVGLSHALVRSFAGSHVVAIEPSEYRRNLARDLGVQEVIAPGDAIGGRPDLVIECTGVPECIRLALDTVVTGGTVLQSGECQSVTIEPSETIIRREITYTGSWFYAHEDYERMVGLVREGLPIHRLATHVFPAADIDRAYRAFTAKETGKVLLEWV